MYIFVDDERIPTQVTWVSLPRKPKEEEWKIVRSYDEFIKLIESLEKAPQVICFDHDLGADSKDGNVCAKAFIEIFIDKKWGKHNWPRFVVHSMNPVGKKNIEETLKNGTRWI